VVVGPVPLGPIRKVKKAMDVKINKIVSPKTAIDNHSPALNISMFSILKVTIF
jgi:hypothetical protein